jgi:hypothetical protein
MKRSEVLPAGVARAARTHIASLGLAVASLAGTACAPDQSVKPGAPELFAYYVIQAGPTPTKILPKTPDCPTPAAGATCRPMPPMPEEPDTLCRDVAASHWCNCIADGTDPTMGAWNCDPFVGVISVIAIFDRLLDTAPLDPDEPANSPTDIAMATVGASTAFPVLTDYGSNGSPTGLVIPIFAQFFLGNFRTEGPSLFTVPESSPSFPSGAAITVSLNADKVLAKDGTTPFVGTGALLDGVVKFATAPFGATLTPPDLTATSMDPITVTASFTNLVDGDLPDQMVMDPDDVAKHVTATVNGAAAVVAVANVNDVTVAITPMTPWPAGATVVVTLDATTPSRLGETLGAPVTLTFMTP